jgi:hypothetical protein
MFGVREGGPWPSRHLPASSLSGWVYHFRVCSVDAAALRVSPPVLLIALLIVFWDSRERNCLRQKRWWLFDPNKSVGMPVAIHSWREPIGIADVQFLLKSCMCPTYMWHSFLKILLSPTFYVPTCMCMHDTGVFIRLIGGRRSPQLLSTCSRRSP